MDYLRSVSGKNLKPDKVNFIKGDDRAVSQLTDVRCKLAKNNKYTYSQLRVFDGYFHAKEDNNIMIEVIEYDEIIECTRCLIYHCNNCNNYSNILSIIRILHH